MLIKLTSQPIPAARPRVTRFGTYNPNKKYLDKAKREVMSQFKEKPLECPVAIQIIFKMQIPASWSQKKKAQAANLDLMHTKRPDIDNLAKMAVDALIGTVLKDDSQVVHLTTNKIYSEEVGTDIYIDSTFEDMRAFLTWHIGPTPGDP